MREPSGAGLGEVVVEDPLVGVFALHNEFDLLLKEEGSEWRPVGIDELRRVLAARKRLAKSESQDSDSQPAELEFHRTSNEIASDCPKLLRVGEVTGLDDCAQRIEAALYRTSIPHLRSALTFVVPSMLHARKILRAPVFTRINSMNPYWFNRRADSPCEF